MARKVAKSTKLTPRQERAIELLLLGQSDTAVAEAIHGSRATIARWSRDPVFASVLEAHGREMREAAKRRILGLVDAAIGCVELAVNAGDARIACRVLEALGLLEFPSFAPAPDPHAIEEQSDADRATIAVLQDLRKRALG